MQSPCSVTSIRMQKLDLGIKDIAHCISTEDTSFITQQVQLLIYMYFACWNKLNLPSYIYRSIFSRVLKSTKSLRTFSSSFYIWEHSISLKLNSNEECQLVKKSYVWISCFMYHLTITVKNCFLYTCNNNQHTTQLHTFGCFQYCILAIYNKLTFHL